MSAKILIVEHSDNYGMKVVATHYNEEMAFRDQASRQCRRTEGVHYYGQYSESEVAIMRQRRKELGV